MHFIVLLYNHFHWTIANIFSSSKTIFYSRKLSCKLQIILNQVKLYAYTNGFIISAIIF